MMIINLIHKGPFKTSYEVLFNAYTEDKIEIKPETIFFFYIETVQRANRH